MLKEWLEKNFKFASPPRRNAPVAPPHEDSPLPSPMRKVDPVQDNAIAPTVAPAPTLSLLVEEYRANPNDYTFERICRLPMGKGTVFSYAYDYLTKKKVPEAKDEAYQAILKAVKSGKDVLLYLKYILGYLPGQIARRDQPRKTVKERNDEKLKPFVAKNPENPAQALEEYKRNKYVDSMGNPIDIPAAIEWTNQQILAHKNLFPNWKAVFPINPSKDILNAVSRLQRNGIQISDDEANNVEAINGLIAANPRLKMQPITEQNRKSSGERYSFVRKTLEKNGIPIPEQYKLTWEMLDPVRQGLKAPTPAP